MWAHAVVSAFIAMRGTSARPQHEGRAADNHKQIRYRALLAAQGMQLPVPVQQRTCSYF